MKVCQMDRGAKKLAFALAVSVFAASCLFFVTAISLRFYGQAPWQQAVFAVGLCAAMLGLFYAVLTFGRSTSGLTAVLYLAFFYLSLQSKYFASIVLQLLLLTFPFAWYLFVRRKDIGAALKGLGASGKGWARSVAIGFGATLVLLYPVMLLEVIILRFAGITDMSNVSQVIMGAPAWLMVFSFTVAPFAEEIFFRAFLITGFAGLAKRLAGGLSERRALAAGVLLSTLIFTAAHYSYGSIAEFVGAFTIGLLFALLFIGYRSLLMVAAAHALFNFISVMWMYYGSRMLPG